MHIHAFRMPSAITLAVGLLASGCVASEESEPTLTPTSPPALGEFAAGECQLTASNTVQANDGEIDVRTLPVFVDYPGKDSVFYHDRSGDYMDVPDPVLGEEDSHRLEFARDRTLLFMRSSGDSSLSPELLGEVAVNAVEFESGETYCMDIIPADSEYVGSTKVGYSKERPFDTDAPTSEVLVWELRADGETLFHDSTPVDDGMTNPDRADTSVLSAEVAGQHAQVFFAERGLLKLSPPGSPGRRAIKEPAFEILDFYYENQP